MIFIYLLNLRINAHCRHCNDSGTGHKHHVHVQNYIIPLDINQPPPQY